MYVIQSKFVKKNCLQYFLFVFSLRLLKYLKTCIKTKICDYTILHATQIPYASLTSHENIQSYMDISIKISHEPVGLHPMFWFKLCFYFLNNSNMLLLLFNHILPLWLPYRETTLIVFNSSISSSYIKNTFVLWKQIYLRDLHDMTRAYACNNICNNFLFKKIK